MKGGESIPPNSKTTAKRECCGTCIYYLTDEDTFGNVTDFHHDRSKDEGFCAIRDLFYTVQHDESACVDWEDDGEGIMQ